MDRATIKQETPESLMTDEMIHNAPGTDWIISALNYSVINCEDVTERKLESPMTNSVKNEERMGVVFNDPSSTIISDLVVIAPQEDTPHKCEVFQTSVRPNPPYHKDKINQDAPIPAGKQEFIDVVIKNEETGDVSMLKIYNDPIIKEEIQDCKNSIKLEDDMKDSCVDNLNDVIKTEEQSVVRKRELSEEGFQEDFVESKRFDGDLVQMDDQMSKRTDRPRNHPRTVTTTYSDGRSDLDESHSVTSGKEFDHKEKTIKSFRNQYGLKLHQRTNTGGKPHGCPTCYKRFRNQYDLTAHQRSHTGEKPYACTTCDKSYTSRQSLNHHQTTHTGEKPYACTTCDKSFASRQSLNNHQTTHTGEKPYACTTCDKNFRVQQELVVHQRTHAVKKAYACTTCDKSFTSRGSLNLHQTIHTGEKPYGCTMCDKSFRVHRDLQRHQRTHTGEKPFACTMCDKSFSLQHNLKNHQRTRHRLETSCVPDVIKASGFSITASVTSREQPRGETLRIYQNLHRTREHRQGTILIVVPNTENS